MISIKLVSIIDGNSNDIWVLYYLLAILLVSVIILVLAVKNGSRKRRSNLTGSKNKTRHIRNYEIRKELQGFRDKNRSTARAYYIRHCNRVKSKARIAYKISKKYKLAYSKKYSALNPSYVIQKFKNWYNKNKNIKIKKSSEYSQKIYSLNPLNKKMMSKKHYEQNPGLQKQKSLKRYYENRETILRVTRNKFINCKLSDNKMDILKIALNKENKRRLNKDYYEHNYCQILYRLRSNYSLPAPNSEAKEYYFIKVKEGLYYSPEIVDDLLPSKVKGVDIQNISYDSKCNAASSILLESVLKNRSHKVGVLIRAANSIRKLKLNSFSDFGEQCHTRNSEPYFYESAYLYPNDISDSQSYCNPC